MLQLAAKRIVPGSRLYTYRSQTTLWIQLPLQPHFISFIHWNLISDATFFLSCSLTKSYCNFNSKSCLSTTFGRLLRSTHLSRN